MPGPSPPPTGSWSAPSLPQKNSLLEQAERAAQLFASQQIYQYDTTNTALPMPMATSTAAIAELPSLLTWVQGQVTNQIKIFLNLEIWKILQRLGAGDLSATVAASQIEAVVRQNLMPATWTLDAIAATYGRPGPTAAPAEPIPSLIAYARVYTLPQTPDIVQQWQQDRVFASQRLGGLNPMIIRRVTLDGKVGAAWPALRAKLSAKIGDAAVRPFLGPQATLASAVEQGRLFVADYEPLSLVTGDQNAPGWQKGRRIMAPIALYVRSRDFAGLHLVAIQLNQAATGADTFPVMLSADAGAPGQANNWLLAKMCVQSADLSYNQAVNHLGQTHLIEEAFALATARQLAYQHPLTVLLRKHFAALLVINQVGSLTLLKPGPDGLINQILAPGLSGSVALITNRYDAWRFDQLDFTTDIQERGLSAADLPYFPYRDDGMEIWTVLGNYARDYLALYYLSDADVTGDYELQNWAKELSREAGGSGKVPGFKPSIANRADLAGILQKLLWTASAQHAAVNFPQIEYASFLPNYPGATFTPPPPDFQKTTTTPEDLLATLPPVTNTQTQVSVTYALAGYHYDQLLDYAGDLEPKAAAVCKRYYDQLTGQIQPRIEARNREREGTDGLLPYPYLLPKNIPNSTSV
ncbi:MAG TPA: lipoxygenase family protein [Acetobacteraceae bacterium]